MSEKQEVYKKYLLERMGYIDNEFLREYISHKNDAVSALQVEHYFRSRRSFTYKPMASHISATDISNFTYCPVAFAIQRTFELPKPKSADIGSTLHETRRLLNYLKPSPSMLKGEPDYAPSRFNFSGAEAQSFIEYIKSSTDIFVGHNNKGEQAKYFKSAKGNYIGQPDYIFRNTNDATDFVVEEKFIFGGNDYYTKEYFFKENHKNQLRSYMYGINEYDLKFGYLVYWVYYSENGQNIVRECRVLKITKSDSERDKLIATYTSLKDALEQKGGIFQSQQLNAKKCANCVVSDYCVHKSGKHNYYTIPYSTEHYSLLSVEFPKELIRLDKADLLTDLCNKWDEVRIKIFGRTFYGFCKKFNCRYGKEAIQSLVYSFMVDAEDKLHFKLISIDATTIHELEKLQHLVGQTIFADWVTGTFEGYRNTGLIEEEKHMYFKTTYIIEQGIVKQTVVNPSDKLYR